MDKMGKFDMDLEWAELTLGYTPSREELIEFKREYGEYLDSLTFEQENPLFQP